MHVRMLHVRNAAAGMESEVNDFARLVVIGRHARVEVCGQKYK